MIIFYQSLGEEWDVSDTSEWGMMTMMIMVMMMDYELDVYMCSYVEKKNRNNIKWDWGF